MRTNPIYAPYQAVQKTWTIRNRYGRTYAKFCIFPSVSISNGRRLTRLRDIQTCGTKSGLLLYASPCYLVRWRRPATGTRWRCSVLKKKNNMCEIIINNLLLLVISIKKYWTTVVCLRYVSFHLILNLQHKKSSKKSSWYTWNHVTHPAQPSYQHKYQHKREFALGMDVSHGLMTIMRNITTSSRSSYATQTKSR